MPRRPARRGQAGTRGPWGTTMHTPRVARPGRIKAALLGRRYSRWRRRSGSAASRPAVQHCNVVECRVVTCATRRVGCRHPGNGTGPGPPRRLLVDARERMVAQVQAAFGIRKVGAPLLGARGRWHRATVGEAQGFCSRGEGAPKPGCHDTAHGTFTGLIPGSRAIWPRSHWASRGPSARFTVRFGRAARLRGGIGAS